MIELGASESSSLAARLVVLGLALAFVAVAISAAAPNTSASAVLSWTSETPMGATVAQAVVVGAENGTVYVMGGASDMGYAPVSSAYSYDPASGDWRVLAPMLYATRGSAGAMGHDGKVYVFGGQSGSGYTQIYDPIANSWSLGTAMLQSAWEAKAATVTNGTIWVVGGEGVTTPGFAQLYDPVGDSWSVGSPAPADVLCGAIVAVGDDLYYSGGGVGDYTGTTNFFMYDASAGNWVSKQDLTSALAAHAMVVGVDGLLYVVGGSSDGYNSGADAFSTVQVYDPASNQWSAAPDMSSARKYLGATVTPGGKILALGGNTPSVVLDVVESLQLYLFHYSIGLSSSSVRAGETVLLTLDAQFTFINESFSVVSWYLESVLGGTIYSSGSLMIPTGAPAAITIEVPTLAPQGNYMVVVESWTIIAEGGVVEVVNNQKLALQVLTAPEPTDALIADLEAQIAALQSQLASDDANLTALRAQTTALQAQVSALIAGLTARGAEQTAAQATLNTTLANLQLQLDAFQEQINRVENKADTAGMYGVITLVLVIVVIVLLALILLMSRRRAPAPPAP